MVQEETGHVCCIGEGVLVTENDKRVYKYAHRKNIFPSH